ncbi:hypothetical protein pdam_00024888 [Pocillopora damicornis]|uniref:Uncharacterized protein n=1 Tax=Pocillopora damicornis TaxID=46731 RepID=A0A3M6UXN5_POCDA|nr:hypothetical protein pdam_00024888 [Pocillopora damicornis]
MIRATSVIWCHLCCKRIHLTISDISWNLHNVPLFSGLFGFNSETCIKFSLRLLMVLLCRSSVIYSVIEIIIPKGKRDIDTDNLAQI